MRSIKHLLSAHVGLTALLLPHVVLAQEASPQDDATRANQGIAEIVVTAQRRAESVQKSSLAIQVLDPEALKTVKQARDLGETVPGLQIANGGNTPQTFIRGVGAFSSDAGVQQAVTYNLGSVVIADAASVIPHFYDLERVEVLKGPQGTLYGRNSSAGAINIIPARPDLLDLGGYVSTDFGNYDRASASGAVNVPLADMAAVRGSFNIVHRDGYLSQGGDDDKQRGGRLQFLVDNQSGFSLLVIGDIEQKYGKGPSAVYLPHLSGRGKFTELTALTAADYAAMIFPPLQGIATGPGAGFDFAGIGPGSPAFVSDNNNISVNNKQQGISAELSYDFGPVTATFIPAYRHSRDRLESYTPALPFAEDLETDQQSYEFRLSHESDRLKAVAGVYYFDFDQHDIYDTLINLARWSHYDNNANTKSFAVFGQATFSLTDTLRVIGGIRQTHEKRRLDGVNVNVNPLAGTTGTITYSRKVSFDNTSFRVGLEYDATPANMLYATMSRGFKSGGFNAASGADAYGPETITSYTVGARNRFLDNTLQFNLEAFYWDIKGSQQTHFGFTSTGDICFCTVNAADARSYGFEADLMLKPTYADTFRAQVAYLDTKFSDFSYTVPRAVFLPGSLGCPVVPVSGGAACQADCSGFPLPRSPKWSGTVGYSHVFDLGEDGSIAADTSANFATSRWLAVDYIPNEKAGGYVRWNASLGYKFADGQTNVTAYIENITNEEIATGGLQPPFAPGIVAATVNAPRTYGVRFSHNF